MWQLQEVKLGLILGNLQHNLVIHRRLDVALGATAQQSASLVRETVVQCLRGKWARWVPSVLTGSSSGRS